ncbi:hypothetical protein AgCh_023789 [Apium graveolens]
MVPSNFWERMSELAEAHKKEKQRLNLQIVKLQEKLQVMQRLELEIEQMSSSVEDHLIPIFEGGGEDVDANKQIECLKENLKKKDKHIEDLEELNVALIIKEKKINDKLKHTRKLLIDSWKRNGNAFKGEGKKGSPETEDESEGDHEEADGNVHGEKEIVNGVSKNSDEENPKRARIEEKETDTEATKKRKRVPSKKSSGKTNYAEDSKTKKSITVKKSGQPPKKASPTPKKSASKEKAGTRFVKGQEKPKAEKLNPSDHVLKNAICEILKEADFNTTTFKDILNQLGQDDPKEL